jgi:adenine phosphoribosyltransferase
MSDMRELDLKRYIRDVPDFPKPGIVFRDITPLLASPRAFAQCVDCMAAHFQDRAVDVVVAAEARGFIFAAPLALALQASFVPIRKSGKLPFDTRTFHYELEYGTDTLEMHVDGVSAGQNVLVVDDLLATGGTVNACCKLLSQSGAHIVGCAFAIELLALNGAALIGDHEIFSIIKYP